MQSRRGFTLIELLVVVAVIALLIAMLLPALGKAHTRAKTAQCLANLRGLDTAFQLYLTDWGKLFPCSSSNPLASWTQLLMNGGQASPDGSVVQQGGYGGIAKLCTCPEAIAPIDNAPQLAIGTAHTQWANSSLTGTGISASYGFNGWLYDATATSQNFFDLQYLMSISSLTGIDPTPYFYRWPTTRDEAAIPVFADANWRHVLPKPDDPAPTDLESPGPASVGSPEQHHPMQRFCMDRHERAVNVTFLDGHAETVPLANLWTLRWSANWQTPANLPLIP